MQHINNHLQVVTASEKNQAVSVSSQQPLTNLNKQEVEVLEKKYAEPQIKSLNDAEIFARASDAVRRIHVITGWNVPDDIEYTKILIEELALKLKEDFSNLNFTEVVYAFRKNGLGVKDWGKNMNLDLVCEVLTQYCYNRERVSEQEERIKNKPEQIIYTAEQLEDIQRGDIEAFYQRCRKGIIPPKELPTYYKELLVKDGFMAEESDINEFFVYWLGRGYENIYIKNTQ